MVLPPQAATHSRGELHTRMGLGGDQPPAPCRFRRKGNHRTYATVTGVVRCRNGGMLGTRMALVVRRGRARGDALPCYYVFRCAILLTGKFRVAIVRIEPSRSMRPAISTRFLG